MPGGAAALPRYHTVRSFVIVLSRPTLGGAAALLRYHTVRSFVMVLIRPPTTVISASSLLKTS
jgi:hypothetical protein